MVMEACVACEWGAHDIEWSQQVICNTCKCPWLGSLIGISGPEIFSKEFVYLSKQFWLRKYIT